MALKLPTPSFLKGKSGADATPPTTSAPAPAKQAAKAAPKDGGGLFGSLFGAKKIQGK